MNMSDLLTTIKMDLGIYGLRLPFDDPDKTLATLIQKRTVKTFSMFYPQVVTITVNLGKDLKCIKEEYTESIYIIPEGLFGGREIMYLRNIGLKNKLLGNGFISPVFDGNIATYNEMMMTQAQANLASVAAPPITFKFEPPNKIYLFNVATAYGEVDLDFGLEHAENLSTIPATAWESFYELALIDVKRFLYNTMKHYSEIQSAYGNINLKIDEWSNSESDRRELIERFRNVYHLETEPLFII